MRINLFDFVDNNESTKCLEEEIEFRKELSNLIASIIKGEEKYYSNNKKLVTRIGIKYKKSKEEVYNGFGISFTKKTNYIINLDEENIKRIQEYIDFEVCNGEETN